MGGWLALVRRLFAGGGELEARLREKAVCETGVLMRATSTSQQCFGG